MQRAAQPAPSRQPPKPALADLAGHLRASWKATAESVTGTTELAVFLDQRLDELERQGRLDQAALSEVIDAAAARLEEDGFADVAALLVRRLLRSVYESLLAVDAHRQQASLPPEGVDGIPVLLRQGRLGDAAAALTVLADRGSGTDLVAVALDAGDACSAGGLAREARACYLAAWTTDRLDERPLWRLAAVALAAGDVELALSYLRQISVVLEWRGDLRGAARVSRKMSVLAARPGEAAVPARRAWPGPSPN